MIETQDLTRQLAQRKREEEFLNGKLVGARYALGPYLRGLRKQQWKVSLDDMADRIGCAKSYLWQIEAGGGNPSLLLAMKIAKHYKTTVGQMAKHMYVEAVEQ